MNHDHDLFFVLAFSQLFLQWGRCDAVWSLGKPRSRLAYVSFTHRPLCPEISNGCCRVGEVQMLQMLHPAEFLASDCLRVLLRGQGYKSPEPKATRKIESVT